MPSFQPERLLAQVFVDRVGGRSHALAAAFLNASPRKWQVKTVSAYIGSDVGTKIWCLGRVQCRPVVRPPPRILDLLQREPQACCDVVTSEVFVVTIVVMHPEERALIRSDDAETCDAAMCPSDEGAPQADEADVPRGCP